MQLYNQILLMLSLHHAMLASYAHIAIKAPVFKEVQKRCSTVVQAMPRRGGDLIRCDTQRAAERKHPCITGGMGERTKAAYANPVQML